MFYIRWSLQGTLCFILKTTLNFSKNVCSKNTKQRMCVLRIQKKECVFQECKTKKCMFQEYKTKNVCSKNSKQKMRVPRIQNKKCVF